MNNVMTAVLYGVYVFAVLFFLGKIFWGEQDTLKKRLDGIHTMGGPGEALDEKDMRQKKRFKQPQWFDVSGRLQRELDGAGIALNAIEFMGLWMAAATVLPTGVYISTGNTGIAAGALAIGAFIPPCIVRVVRKKRLSQFSAQLGDTLMTVGNCLRSGFSIRQSVERIATDMPDPIASEFRMAVTEMNYGAALEDALTGIARRMENRDLELLTTAIRIQQRAGGNLSDIINNVSETIRDRIRIRKSLQTLTAQGRISGLVLGLLPVLALAVLTVLNPDYAGTFYTTSYGIKALILCGVMEAVGFLVIYKIINIQF